MGVCPDELDSSGECTEDVFGVSGSRSNGEQCVTYSRNLNTSKLGIIVVATTCHSTKQIAAVVMWECVSSTHYVENIWTLVLDVFSMRRHCID